MGAQFSSEATHGTCAENCLPLQLMFPTNGLNTTKESVIIFDWDDTLICSSALYDLGVMPKLLRSLQHPAAAPPVGRRCRERVPPAEMQILAQVTAQILEDALKYASVYIVTNATRDWVFNSAERFLPQVTPILDKLTVMSARDQFEHVNPKKPSSWKHHAFASIVKDDVNLVALGDSYSEIEAARASSASLVKTMKFIEEPSMTQLVGQLKRVARELAGVVHGCSQNYILSQRRETSEHSAYAWRLRKAELFSEDAGEW
jgi:phosphoglycolate phosphatase-like HAD superfamily hydrolase